MSAAPGRALGSHRVALHLGEIAQDDRWEKQRNGRMMALHWRSRAGPVRSSLGKRVLQTRNAQLGFTMLDQRTEPDEPSKSRPTTSPSDAAHPESGRVDGTRQRLRTGRAGFCGSADFTKANRNYAFRIEGAGATVHLRFFCSSSHCTEPGRHTVWAGSGWRRRSAALASLR